MTKQLCEYLLILVIGGIILVVTGVNVYHLMVSYTDGFQLGPYIGD